MLIECDAFSKYLIVPPSSSHSSPSFILILCVSYSVVEQSQIMDQGGGILELHKDLKMPHAMIMPDFGKECHSNSESIN